MPILLVTHDPRILDIADRIAAMEDGRIVSAEAGPRRRGAPWRPRRGFGAASRHPEWDSEPASRIPATAGRRCPQRPTRWLSRWDGTSTAA